MNFIISEFRELAILNRAKPMIDLIRLLRKKKDTNQVEKCKKSKKCVIHFFNFRLKKFYDHLRIFFNINRLGRP